jgi:hypothetical protein
VRLHDLSVPIVADTRECDEHEEEEVEGGAVRGGRGEHLALDLLLRLRVFGFGFGFGYGYGFGFGLRLRR